MDSSAIGIALKLAVFVFSIMFHEVAHGYIAWRLGDPTAEQQRRLTFNPVHHIDPFGSIILPLILAWSGSPVVLGWAKPVPFNPLYFRNPKRGVMLVGLAGPASNLFLALAVGIAYRILSPTGAIAEFLVLMCLINVVLAVFNLTPVPPLDGSRVVLGLLPPRLAEAYIRIEPYGFLIIFGLLYLGLFNLVLLPIAGALLRLFLG